MAILVITVNMQCCRCEEKIDKILNSLRCKYCIEKIEYEGEKVIVRGSFCAEQLRKCIWRKAGCKIIVNIIIVEVWPPPPVKPVDVNVNVKAEVTANTVAAAEAAARAAVEVMIKEKCKQPPPPCKPPPECNKPPECKLVPYPYPVPYPMPWCWPCKCGGGCPGDECGGGGGNKTPCCSPPRCPQPPPCPKPPCPPPPVCPQPPCPRPPCPPPCPQHQHFYQRQWFDISNTNSVNVIVAEQDDVRCSVM